jgi:hypothetical protein
MIALAIFVMIGVESVFAAISIPRIPNLGGFDIIDIYHKYQSWFDFVIFFFIFSSIVRLALEKQFGKVGEGSDGTGGKESAAFKPLYLGLGAALSFGLSAWMNIKGHSMADSGPLVLAFLAIGLLAAIVTYAYNQRKDPKKGSQGALPWIWLVVLLIVAAFLIFFMYPGLLGNFVPYGIERDLMSWFGLLFIAAIFGLGLYGLYKLFSKFGSGTKKEKKDGDSDDDESDFMKWIKKALLPLGIILVLLLLLAALFGTGIGPFGFGGFGMLGEILGWGFALLLGLPLLLLALWAIWHILKFMISKGIHPKGWPKRGEKLNVEILAVDGLGPFAKGMGLTPTFQGVATGDSATTEYNYEFVIRGQSISNPKARADTHNITLDIDGQINIGPDTERKLKLVLWATSVANPKLKGSAVAKFKVTQNSAGGVSLVMEAPVRHAATHNLSLGDRITPDLQTRVTGDSARVSEVRYTYANGRLTGGAIASVAAGSPAPAGTLGIVNSLSGWRTKRALLQNIVFNPSSGTGEYTIIASAFNNRGNLIPGAIDYCYFTVGTASSTQPNNPQRNGKIEIVDPVTNGNTHTMALGDLITPQLKVNITDCPDIEVMQIAYAKGVYPNVGRAYRAATNNLVLASKANGDFALDASNNGIFTRRSMAFNPTDGPGRYTVVATALKANGKLVNKNCIESFIIEVTPSGGSPNADDIIKIIDPATPPIDYTIQPGDTRKINLRSMITQQTPRGRRIKDVVWLIGRGNIIDPLDSSLNAFQTQSARANNTTNINFPNRRANFDQAGTYSIIASGMDSSGVISSHQIIVNILDAARNGPQADSIEIIEPTASSVHIIAPGSSKKINIKSLITTQNPRGRKIKEVVWLIGDGAITDPTDGSLRAFDTQKAKTNNTTSIKYPDRRKGFNRAGRYSILVSGIDDAGVISSYQVMVEIQTPATTQPGTPNPNQPIPNTPGTPQLPNTPGPGTPNTPVDDIIEIIEPQNNPMVYTIRDGTTQRIELKSYITKSNPRGEIIREIFWMIGAGHITDPRDNSLQVINRQRASTSNRLLLEYPEARAHFDQPGIYSIIVSGVGSSSIVSSSQIIIEIRRAGRRGGSNPRNPQPTDPRALPNEQRALPNDQRALPKGQNALPRGRSPIDIVNPQRPDTLPEGMMPKDKKPMPVLPMEGAKTRFKIRGIDEKTGEVIYSDEDGR